MDLKLKKMVNCQPRSGILMFLACGAYPSCDTLVFSGELSYHYIETCVLKFFDVCDSLW